jgi:hypothetical protein
MNKFAATALTAAVLALPGLAFAESTTVNPAAAASTASARLDFTVVIPAVLYLRVGTGNAVNAVANNTTVDSLTFTVPGANIGDASVITAGATDGDLGNGAVTVRVFSNVGTNVTLNSSVSGQLVNGTGDTIPWTQIAVASAADPTAITGWTNTGITHPTFSATTGPGTATTLTAASKLVRQQGKWTFTYLNANVMPAGTYGSTVAKNGRVTYTALQL